MDQAKIAQQLKNVVLTTSIAKRATPVELEALDMILHKISRLLNGDPHYIDTWHDIEGYAHLVVEINTKYSTV